MDDLMELLKEIAEGGVPFRYSVVDDSAGTGRTYLDLVHDGKELPYRLELIGPDDL